MKEKSSPSGRRRPGIGISIRAACALSALLITTSFALGVIWRDWKLPPNRRLFDLAQPAARKRTERRLPINFIKPENRSGSLTPQQQAEIDRLNSLGYLNARNLAEGSGVTVYDRDSAYAGLNLSNEGNGGEATLRDMEGNVLHVWRFPFEKAFPDQRPKIFQEYWRRIRLLEDGSLLAIFDGHSLVKIDSESQLVWIYAGGAHHDLDILRDGRILCLARTAEIVPSFNRNKPVLHDFVVLLDSSGRETKRISILKAILKSPYATILSRAKKSGDVLHTNTLEILDGSLANRLPAFEKGRLLLSMPSINTIAVLDPESERIVWALTDQWVFQHQPTVVRGKNLLIFDNRGDGGRSRVLEFDPVTQEIEWAYTNRQGPLFSNTLGSVQELPNGNVLITESNQGRAIEVTRDHRVVWEYYSPHRGGEDGELIAQLFEMIRLPPNFPTGWSKGPMSPSN